MEETKGDGCAKTVKAVASVILYCIESYAVYMGGHRGGQEGSRLDGSYTSFGGR